MVGMVSKKDSEHFSQNICLTIKKKLRSGVIYVMKRFVHLIIIFIMANAIFVNANSAPSYWEAYPYSEVLAVDKDCPVVVNSEHLTFDFSQDYEYGNNFSPVARVNAGYEMMNPTDGTLYVQMAFPFVASLTDLSVSDIAIRVDDETIPYEIYIDPDDADVEGSDGEGFSYGGVGDILKDPIVSEDFDLNNDAKLYRLKVDMDSKEDVDFKINFNVNPQKTRLIVSGFNGGSYGYSDGEGSSISARISNSEAMEILILGEDFEFTYEVYSNENKKLPKDSYNIDIIQDTADPGEYLSAAIRQDIRADISNWISDDQLLAPYVSRIFRESRVTGFVMLQDVLAAGFTDRIITLVYSVEFPAQETRRVSVGYLSAGVMDSRETTWPQYSYTYLLSPAQNWADFANLDIEIMTPEEAPYIIKSNLELTADGRNRYTASFDALPKEELSFTLYKNAKATFADKVQKKVSKLSYALYFLWPVLAIIVAASVLFVGRAITRRKKS